MRLPLAIKALFRTPGKTAFTLLLIAVLTFSIFLQLAEYVKTAEEFKVNVAMYKGTGYVEVQPAVYKGPALNYPYYLATDPRVDAAGTVDAPRLQEFKYPGLSAETVDALAALPYITSVEKRYMTAGVSEDHRRIREELTRYDYNGRIILEGTLSQLNAPHPMYGEEIRGYRLSDVEILAGDARLQDLLYDDGTVFFQALDAEWDHENFPTDEWLPGVSAEDVILSNLNSAWPRWPFYFSNYSYIEAAQAAWRQGDRYVFVFRFERQATKRLVGTAAYNVTQMSLFLYDWVSEHFCPAVWDVTGAPENYLELPEYAPLKNLIEITETDLHTFDTVYAEDMTAIRQIHDNTLQLKAGRWLMREDTETNAKVCVLDEDLAARLKLKLGDTLSLRLGNALFEQFYSLGAIASTEERFADRWTEEEFEIVGLYGGGSMMKDANEPNWAYSMNTVFVPLASLPLTEDELAGHEFYPGELTFRVDNAWDIPAFLEETAPRIEAMGLTLMFDDGGWMEVLEAYRTAQKIPMIRIILLAFVTVTGLALSVYLFVSRKKKDYAIMRALGTPKGRSGRALLVPITVLSLAAMLAAATAGLVYSQLVIGRVFLWPVLICIGGELVFTLFFTALSIRRMSKLPPLMLLHGSGSRAQKARRATVKKKQSEAVQGTLYVPMNMKLNTEPLPITRRPASPGFVLSYVRRHIRRQGVKSVLAVLLAALMVGAVVQFASLRDTYNTLRESTPVPVNFTKVLSLDKLQLLEDEGFTKDVYYERLTHLRCMSGLDYYVEAQVVITSDIDRFLGNEAYEIVLGDGYSMEDLGKRDYVVLSSDLMEKYGLQPHDTVRFGLADDIARLRREYVLKYAHYLELMGEPSEGVLFEDAYENDKEYIERSLSINLAEAEVIGSIQTDSDAYRNTAFTAGINHATSIIGSTQSIDAVEFTLADNSRAEALYQRCEELCYGRNEAFSVDTARLESIMQTSDLLNKLYLPVIALALLIGAAMCALLVMQTTKDAAIMRAQGTTKRTTRSILAVEQIILGVIGVMVGLAVMLVWKRGDFAAIALQAGLFATAYALILVLGSFASAALATKKNILELLQTKE